MKTKNILNKLFTLPLKHVAAITITCVAIGGYSAAYSESNYSSKTLDGLLEQVIKNKNIDSIENEKRIKQFQNKKNEQQQLLNTINSAIDQQESISLNLKNSINENEKQLADLEKNLADAIGSFGELFGVTRQVAAETSSQISSSIISAQFPNREHVLDSISSSKTLPTLEELRQLWIVLLQEQTEQGKVVKFNTLIDDENGISQNQEAIRVGPFTAVSNNKFVTYSDETKRLTTLSRQPSSTYVGAAKQLSQSSSNQLVNVAIDPSRGTILGLLVQTPNLFERFKQGGLPGYLVSALAVIGLIIGIQRLVSLWITTGKVNRQIKTKTINLKNPLGRVLDAYESYPSADVETLELKLNDAVLKEIPKLDKGLNLLKVLAAVAPLMGLLGTVVGMIVTFQAITLWGAGEPKLMAGGISQALITTVQGLVAAIPLLLLHSIANGRARLVQQILEEQSAGLIANRAEAFHKAA
ncbi:MAG: MotA/TolQ/ExbB proton channel family protein [Cellvibrionaceae bacterium]